MCFSVFSFAPSIDPSLYSLGAGGGGGGKILQTEQCWLTIELKGIFVVNFIICDEMLLLEMSFEDTIPIFWIS